MKVVGLSGTVIGAKTAKTVEAVLKEMETINPAIETELVDLREYEVEMVKGIPFASYNDDTKMVVEKILSADLLVFGTPIYQASIPGVLKNLFDHLPPESLKGKIAGTITNGGSEKHFLVTEYALKPILSYLKARIPSSQVFVHTSCFDQTNTITDQEINDRIHVLAEEMLSMK